MKQLPNNMQATHKGKLEIVTPHQVPHELVFKEKKKCITNIGQYPPILRHLFEMLSISGPCHINPAFLLNAKLYFHLKLIAFFGWTLTFD